ncbi:superoxide dismutase [Pseudoglutamicibacter albus]|nr:superoxide dismutase [Pseudoglutamicibacter albus]
MEVNLTQYTLPDLDYDYGALEPHISGKIMELHHSKHHATYVKGANTALEQLAEARDKGDLSNVNKLTKDLAFNLGGHTNHSIFWKNLSPEGGGEPTGELAEAINEHFGSFENFKKHINAAALGIQGSGWALLSYEGIGGKLLIEQLHDQQGDVPVATQPLLMLDMWEHAFYLDYLNVKADYVDAFWNIVNWDNVSERYAAAKEGASKLVLPGA